MRVGGTVGLRALGTRTCPLKLNTKAPLLIRLRKAVESAGSLKVTVISKVLRFTSIKMPLEVVWPSARAITDLRLSTNSRSVAVLGMVALTVLLNVKRKTGKVVLVVDVVDVVIAVVAVVEVVEVVVVTGIRPTL